MSEKVIVLTGNYNYLDSRMWLALLVGVLGVVEFVIFYLERKQGMLILVLVLTAIVLSKIADDLMYS